MGTRLFRFEQDRKGRWSSHELLVEELNDRELHMWQHRNDIDPKEDGWQCEEEDDYDRETVYLGLDPERVEWAIEMNKLLAFEQWLDYLRGNHFNHDGIHVT